MDWGMARSGNQHTTRQLASCLKMNYIFGVEFIELTKGNKEEQERTRGKENSWGWHGNAILSKSEFKNFSIVRLPGTESFWKNGLNGAEQRDGGRMAITTLVDNVRVICTHLDYFVGQRYNKEALMTLGSKYVDEKMILAGDLGTPGRDRDTPSVLEQFGFDNSPNSDDNDASGDWILSKNVKLQRIEVKPSRHISDHNILVTRFL